MGSATTQALTATRAALNAATGIDLGVARELFATAHLIGESSQLRGALADPAAAVDARTRVVADVFGKALGATSVSLLTSAVEQRWSRADDLVSGIEDLAVRAAAISAPDTDIEGELFSVSRTVAENPELELALGSRLGDADAKAGLFEKVFGGSTSEATN